jgi:teichuronic acid biosynthesis glycosyltransferase TuaG
MPDLELTVVIPAFNAGRTIAGALDSVRAQTLAATEVIVVDDGSADDTSTLVSDYILRHALLGWHLLGQQNGGPARARDKAIRAATCAYVALLDADDVWLPEKLEISVAHMIAQRLDILGARLRADGRDDVCRILDPRRMLFSNPYFTSTVVFSKAAYLDVGGFDLTQRYSEDYKLWLAFAWRGKRCGQLNRPLANYRADASGPHRGLSSHLWRMEKGELGNYHWLRSQGLAAAGWCLLARGISWLKFARRVISRP